MTDRRIRWLACAALLSVGVGLVCVAIAGLDPSGLLTVLPALLMGCVLLARRYPGEHLLLRSAPADAPRRGNEQLAPRARPRIVSFPRGGLLMGRSLAVRPPPLPAG